jgi:hypothetical protein
MEAYKGVIDTLEDLTVAVALLCDMVKNDGEQYVRTLVSDECAREREGFITDLRRELEILAPTEEAVA